ncbi:MAG: hypothetical protein IID08_01765 [Candidatus Hydrogenedentes bacterium]|nr:hypothetical protein [Candidatus Hydrogenedentota bacterium]
MSKTIRILAPVLLLAIFSISAGADATDAADVVFSAIAQSEKRAASTLTDQQNVFHKTLSRALETIQTAKQILLSSELTQAADYAKSDSTEAREKTEALRTELMFQEASLQHARTYLKEALARFDIAYADTLDTISREMAQTPQSNEAYIESVLTRVAKHHKSLENDIAILNERTRAQAHRIEAILADIQRPSDKTNLMHARLGDLDMQFARLRTEDVSTAGSIENRLAALDQAMSRVSATQAEFPMDTTVSAALTRRTSAQAEAVYAPPTKRDAVERPYRHTDFRSGSPTYRMLGSSKPFRAQEDRIMLAQARGSGISSSSGTTTRTRRPDYSLYRRGVPADEDPLQQLVNIDFRDMDLANVVSLLAQKAEISVMAGQEVSGSVTANLQDVPLGRAIEILLRMNGLGIVEESGVYRITTYEEAVASRRETKMIFLQNAQAADVQATVEALLSGPDAGLMSITSNQATNIIILAGPSELLNEIGDVIEQLDIAEPVIPTVTVPVKLNYAEPADIIPVIMPLLSPSGQVTGDLRSRHVIITDLPIKVEELVALIQSIDLPVKQVSVEAMIVDAKLEDNAQTGVDWTINAIRSAPTTKTLTNLDGIFNLGTGLTKDNAAGHVAFGILSGDINMTAVIMGEVSSGNATLLSNPTIVTVENQTARISIAQEIPYIENSSTDAGGSQTSIKFKEVGTVLEVTPRVTHDNHIIVKIDAKQSDTKSLSVSGVPIEDKREASTTLRLNDGQTVYIGGLRKFDDDLTVRKVPILGDIPILNLLFSNRIVDKQSIELLIFMTCNVLADDFPDLTPYQKEQYDRLGGHPLVPDATRETVRSYIHPEEMRDPFYKWRRSK